MSSVARPTLAHLQLIAKEAGVVTQTYFNKHFAVSEKSDNQGIVTDADFASETAIVSFINREFPKHAILAEESGKHRLANGTEPMPLWVIDPVDGTTNFSKGNAYHCISIGFGLHTETSYEPLLGVVYQPATGAMFSAEKGKGAFLNGEKMVMPKVASPQLACVATGFASAKGDRLRQVVESIFLSQQQFLGTRINGAAALDFANTGRGVFQGFFERGLSPWDIAAGVLIVTEAGGLATNFEGQPFNLMRDRDIVACAPEIHDRLLEIVTKAFL